MPYKDQEKQRAAQYKYYEKNKKKVETASLRARKRRIKLVNELKSRPCTDCGIQYPPKVMGFHHRNPGEKKNKIAAMVLAFGIAKVLEEIKKCDLLCANCHALRH